MSQICRSVFLALCLLLVSLPAVAGNRSDAITLALTLGPLQDSATVVLDNRNHVVRGLSVDLLVAADWVVSDVRASGVGTALNVFHHRNGDTLRVMLVSASEAVMSSGRGPVFEVQLEKSRNGARGSGSAIALLEAKAADEQGAPLTVRLIGQDSTDDTSSGGSGGRGDPPRSGEPVEKSKRTSPSSSRSR